MSINTFTNLPQEKQIRVLNAATEEFAEHGFHQASMNRVVKRLGIAKGSLFKYFGTKEGLFECLFERSLAQIKGSLREAATTEGTFFVRLRSVMLAGLTFIDSHPRLYRIYLKLLFQENAPLRKKLLTTVRSYSAKFLLPLIEQGMAEGELRPDLDVDTALFLVDAVLDRFLQAARVPSLDDSLYGISTDDAQERVVRMLEILCQGFSATTTTTE